MAIHPSELNASSLRPELSSLAPKMPPFLGNLDRFRDIRVSSLDPVHPELGVLVQPKEKRKPMQQESSAPEESLEVLAPDIEAAEVWLNEAFDAIYQNRVIEGVQRTLFIQLTATDDIFKKIRTKYNALNPKPGTDSSPKPAV